MPTRRNTPHRQRRSNRRLSTEQLEGRLLLTASGDLTVFEPSPADESAPLTSGVDFERLGLDDQVLSLIAAAEDQNGDPSARPVAGVGIFAAFEFAPEGTVVGSVRATTADRNSLSFSLLNDGNTDTDGDGVRPFRIDSTNGDIIVNDSGDLDLSLLPSQLFVLLVEVRDSDGTTVAPQIVDVVPGPPTLTVNSAEVEEGGDLVFTVTSDKAADTPFDVTVTFQSASATSADFTNTAQTVSFEGTAGESHQVTVSTNDDDIVELTESFNVRLSASDPFILDGDTGTGTITDNDSASLTVEDASGGEGSSLSFNVALDNPVYAAFDVEVSFADGTATGGASPLSAPSDFDNSSIILSFTGEAGEMHSFSVGTTADSEEEAAETFTVNLASSNDMVDASDTSTGTIVDNAPPVISSLLLTIPENQETGAFIGSLSAEDPEGQSLSFSLLSNANPNGNQFVAVALDPVTGDITVQDANDFNFELSNNFTFDVQVTEASGLLSSDATVQVTLTDVNEAPIIDPINNVVTGTNSASVEILGSDPDDGQTFDSSVLEIVSFVTDGLTPLQQDVFAARLILDSGTDYFNEFGGEEKWLRSALSGAWYFILPDSRIYEWDQTPGTLTGRLLGQLDSTVYDDPSLISAERLAGPLSNPQNVPIPPGSATATLDGNVVTVASTDFFGLAHVTVRATDLNGTGLSDEETFSVEFAQFNQPPVLEPIDDQVSAGGALQIVVPLVASDPDGDPLIYDARILGPVPASVTVEDGVLTITRRGRFFGAFSVEVGVRDRHGARVVQVFQARFVPPTSQLNVQRAGVAVTEEAPSRSTVALEQVFRSPTDFLADRPQDVVEDLIDSTELESADSDDTLLDVLFSGELL